MRTAWHKDLHLPEHPKLTGDAETEVVIIGGGITGITLSYLLAKAGKKVIVIDKESLSESVTAKTTAFLTSAIDTGAEDLIRIYGQEKASSIWRSHKDAIDDIEKIIAEEKINCEFRRVPQYFYTTDWNNLDDIIREEVAARTFGFAVEDLQKNVLPFKNFGGFVLKNQAKFHPLKYASALRECAESLGVKFHEETRARSISHGNKIKVRTSSGTITAPYCVIATYLPLKNPWPIFARKGVYQSYVIELDLISGNIPEGLYEDDMEPYHYMRVDRLEGRTRIIIGGEDHRKELPMDPTKNFEALEEYTKEHFPKIDYKVVSRWRGPILKTLDGLAYIGTAKKREENIFYATGFSGNGMTYSMLAGKIISEAILGEKNKYADLYTPFRNQLNLKSLWIKTCDYLGIFFGGYVKNVWRRVHNAGVMFEKGENI